MSEQRVLQSWSSLPRVLLVLSLSVAHISYTSAQPANIQFQDCFNGNISQKLNVSNVYAQVLQSSSGGKYLNFTVLGQNPATIVLSSSQENLATTLFTTTEMLTFNVWNNNSYFCETLRPPSPLPTPGTSGYCPFPPGPFAFSSSVDLPSNYELVTFDTQLRALDPYQHELLCLNMNTTVLDPGAAGSVYGNAHIIFWVTVTLAIAYWVVVGSARLVAAWCRGITRNGAGIWSRVESVGFMLASAISGERLASSPALMRFCTPSLRDIIFHTQWCAALAMVAVQWPGFVYPLLSQTAWSTLTYNISLSQGAEGDAQRWNPLTVPPFDPPSDYADQLNNASSHLFVDSDAPNLIFQLPNDATHGISSFAWAVGIRPQDLFGMCLTLFLAIIAATIVLSLVVWGLDLLASSIIRGTSNSGTMLAGSRSPRYTSASKDMLDGVGGAQFADENRSLNGNILFRTTSRFPPGRPSWRLQTNFISYHGSVLQGNLVRILILFHLPVTIFSCYQMTLGRPRASLVSIILAALSFAGFSVLLPAFLIFRLTFTNTTKLYDETWTLLSLGPLYNHYRHGSQLFACLLFATNLAFGVTIGCGQKSGTAQAIIILVVEVISALGTSVWLPWGQGASMGLISFLFCVARIVIAVLLVILTPIVSIDSGAAQWVAYAILCILGLVYLSFYLMLIVKLVEAALRIFGGIGFDHSKHVVDSGLLGTMGLLGCCGSRKPSRSSRGRFTSSNAGKQPSTLPLTRPAVPFKDSTPTPSQSGPPSVLRPEHALQPYKEDSDDETGYIMGAWQPFPGPGYTHVEEAPQTPPEAPKSGFARVGGGRAHIDSPYAIASGSTHTFPSIERNLPSSSLAQTPSPVEYSPPPTPSVGSVAKHADVNLPPGAVPPAHIRKKSQTAIIEDVSELLNLHSAAEGSSRYATAVDATEDDPPKKRHWYNRRKSRRMSEGDLLTSSAAGQDVGHSFVVVRKSRPGIPPKETSGSFSGGGGGLEDGRRSFSVLRSSNPM